jgi:hypothetical protein
MLSAEAITDEVCRGIGSSGSDSEKLEVHMDIRNHGLEGLHKGLLDGVLGSELHLEPKHTCLHCNRTRMARSKGKVQGQPKIGASEVWPVIIKMNIPIEVN